MAEKRKGNLSKETADRLTGYIRSNGFKEGDRLPSERELSAQFGVSRTTVREALKKLAAIGYIESRHGGGTFVKKIDFGTFIDPLSATLNSNVKMFLELLEVRKMLECETARLAAERINETNRKIINDALAQMEKEIAEGGTGIDGDSEFHLAIAKATENGALKSILEMCRDILNTTRNTTLSSKKKRDEALRDHRKIARAIFSGDQETAVAEMKKHIDTACANISLSRKQ